ncbi:MAG: aminotransferase class V-fold PLP-dependent enzyme [Mariniblastus sp.]|nr:aminotransferase class V-fold PLP-dependent enzyme [Mariniblastus sp.]
MWARKRIDIGVSDLIVSTGKCLFPGTAASARSRIANYFQWELPFVCLSVRSGFDLALASAIEVYSWEPDSEIIFSGLTIPDMPLIAAENGLKAVGADIDWATLTPSAAEIESKINSRTRAIVVAHLMGGKLDLTEISEIAHRHGLLLIEDCAQSFSGKTHQADKSADISMLSFGSIKTNTALGGAVFRVQDSELQTEMEKRHAQWPIRSTTIFLKRLVKYFFVKTISTWPFAAAIRLSFQIRGSNHDAMAAGMARGFSGPNFFQQIRHQPSVALQNLLATRLEQFNPGLIATRTDRGELLSRVISEDYSNVKQLGFSANRRSHWVFAVLVANPKELVQTLWNRGFDATTHCSLVPVGGDKASPFHKKIMRHIVFLPIDPPMPNRELVRMGKIVAQNAKGVELQCPDPIAMNQRVHRHQLLASKVD